MQVTIDGKMIDVPSSRLDDIRVAYSETEHIVLPEPQLRVVFKKSDAAATPIQVAEQE